MKYVFKAMLASPLNRLGELMVIKSEKVLRRYTHFSEESFRSALESLDAMGQKIMM